MKRPSSAIVRSLRKASVRGWSVSSCSSPNHLLLLLPSLERDFFSKLLYRANLHFVYVCFPMKQRLRICTSLYTHLQTRQVWNRWLVLEICKLQTGWQRFLHIKLNKGIKKKFQTNFYSEWWYKWANDTPKDIFFTGVASILCKPSSLCVKCQELKKVLQAKNWQMHHVYRNMLKRAPRCAALSQQFDHFQIWLPRCIHTVASFDPNYPSPTPLQLNHLRTARPQRYILSPPPILVDSLSSGALR